MVVADDDLGGGEDRDADAEDCREENAASFLLLVGKGGGWIGEPFSVTTMTLSLSSSSSSLSSMELLSLLSSWSSSSSTSNTVVDAMAAAEAEVGAPFPLPDAGAVCRLRCGGAG